MTNARNTRLIQHSNRLLENDSRIISHILLRGDRKNIYSESDMNIVYISKLYVRSHKWFIGGKPVLLPGNFAICGARHPAGFMKKGLWMNAIVWSMNI